MLYLFKMNYHWYIFDRSYKKAWNWIIQHLQVYICLNVIRTVLIFSDQFLHFPWWILITPPPGFNQEKQEIFVYLFEHNVHSHPFVKLEKAYYILVYIALSPPQCSSHTVKRTVLLVSSGSSSGRRLLHSMTIAWGIMITQDTNQITMMLRRARFAVLLNFRGWQIAYHRSWAMQLRVNTDTDTEIVWSKQKIKKEKRMNIKDVTVE